MGKKYKAAQQKLDSAKALQLKEAVDLVQAGKFANFNETLEISMNLGVDPRHSDQMVRGMTSLPAGTGKDVRVAVICKEDKVDAAKEAGADLVNAAALVDDIKAGKIDFDVCIATPDMMGVIGQVARVLGPKGLMPNPKLGTVTPDVASAVKKAKSGQVEFRVEKAGVIHAGIGKLSFKAEDLLKNAETFIGAVIKAKPSGAKGTFVKSVYMSSTMGPSVKVDVSTITQ